MASLSNITLLRYLSASKHRGDSFLEGTSFSIEEYQSFMFSSYFCKNLYYLPIVVFLHVSGTFNSFEPQNSQKYCFINVSLVIIHTTNLCNSNFNFIIFGQLISVPGQISMFFNITAFEFSM